MAAKRDPTRDALAAIAALEPGHPDTPAALRRYLARKSGPVVAAAARVVGAHRIEALRGPLVAAWPGLFVNPVKRDPGCAAKIAVVQALGELDHLDPDVYIQAARHRQPEPSWGPPIDTAAGLRGHAILALAALSYPDTPLLIAEGLADAEARTRQGAAQALTAWNEPTIGQALARLALGKGDPDPEVVEELFASVVALGGLSWAVMHLHGELPAPEGQRALYAEAAALALGASRDPEAFGPLRRWTERAVRANQRRVGIIAMGLLRSDAAARWLLETLEEDDPGDREALLQALEVYRGDPEVDARLQAASG